MEGRRATTSTETGGEAQETGADVVSMAACGASLTFAHMFFKESRLTMNGEDGFGGGFGSLRSK